MPLKEKFSCQWPWGGIVVRGVFRRRQQIEYRYDMVRDLQLRRSPRHRPFRWVAPKMMVGVYEEDLPTWKGPVTDCGYKKPGVASEHRGDRTDQRQLSWDQRSGSGDPPFVITLTLSDILA